MGSIQRIQASTIGEYVRSRSCARLVKLELIESQAVGDEHPLDALYPYRGELVGTLDPVLQEMGRRAEQRWQSALLEAGLRAKLPAEGERGVSIREFRDFLGELAEGEPAFVRELSVAGEVGCFRIEGRIDFALVLWREGHPFLRLVEGKSSRRDQTYHRMQVAAYRVVLSELLQRERFELAGRPLTADGIELAVARLDELSGEVQSILEVEPFSDAETRGLEDDLRTLLSAGGRIERIAATPLEQLEYTLDERCDRCSLAIVCVPEAQALRSPVLLGVSPGELRELRRLGLGRIDDLAALASDNERLARLALQASAKLDLRALVVRAQGWLAHLAGEKETVVQLPGAPESALPAHETSEHGRLVRIYLDVCYDYAEDRLAALSAHVTCSSAQLAFGYRKTARGNELDGTVCERGYVAAADGSHKPGPSTELPRCARTKEVVAIVPEPGWRGERERDDEIELAFVRGFFERLVESIQGVAGQDRSAAAIHFYFWSRRDLTTLVDALARLDAHLLSPLRDLLGQREGTEQLVASFLGEEVGRRYAIPRVGASLSVVSELPFGRNRFSWKRKLGAGRVVDFAELYRQDLFDYRARIKLPGEDRSVTREVRSRHIDGLTAPYLRARWQQLRDPRLEMSPGGEQEEAKLLKRMIVSYTNAARPAHYLETFLKARAQALRFIEERVCRRNPRIAKQPLELAELASFELVGGGLREACIDFLRLDQAVKVAEWAEGQLDPPHRRVREGRSLPLEGVEWNAERISARLAPARHGLTQVELAGLATIGEGSFCRLTPANSDPLSPQPLASSLRHGATCRVERIDWESGEVELSHLYSRADAYKLASYAPAPGDTVFREAATLDSSPSDFVAGRVERRLLAIESHPIYRWLDPRAPELPQAGEMPGADQLAVLRRLLLLPLAPGSNALSDEQAQAALAGLSVRIQLLQGPPGTGKTQTTAAAILTRIARGFAPGELVCLCAHTHTAIDTLLERLALFVVGYREAAAKEGVEMPKLRLVKIDRAGASQAPVDIADAGTGRVERLAASRVPAAIRDARDAGTVLVVGGTTAGLLALAERAERSSDGWNGCKLLCVDEASMLVLGHFLAVATLLRDDGSLLLAGDHRQLAPIVAHDWEDEDRPPLAAFAPFVSAYAAVERLAGSHGIGRMVRSALAESHRLPDSIARLVAPIYAPDAIELRGRREPPRDTGRALAVDADASTGEHGSWRPLWHERGVLLVLHDDATAVRSSELEAEICKRLLAAAPQLAAGTVGIVTPHRAQRSLLREALAEHADACDVIDTVERLQGGERETVIVSVGVSDPTQMLAEAEFLLNPNRTNVAFSRARERLIVVCPRSLLELVPSELALYQATALWKELRRLCRRELLCEQIGENTVVCYGA